MAGERADSGAGRDLRAVVRYVVGLALGCVVLLLLVGKRGELAAAWHHLAGASMGWVAAAIAAESLSLLAYSWLQDRVLRLSGTTIPLAGLFALTLANDAIASSVPGEPAVSSAYRFHYYRRRGATGASAGWTIFTILIAQAIGMSLLLLVGVLVALAGSTSTLGAGITVLGLIIVVAAGAVLLRRDLVLRLAGAAVRQAGRLTGRLTRRPGDADVQRADEADVQPAGEAGVQRAGEADMRRAGEADVRRAGEADVRRAGVAARIEATLARMREIPLGPADTTGVVAMATAVWFCDFLCLVCSFRAVHAAIPWHGVLLAYGVAQVAGSLPIVPGGFGIVEGSLAVVLVAYGTGRVPAVSAALAYRIVNFWLAIAVGWLSAGLIAYRLRRIRDGVTRAPTADPVLGAVMPVADAEPSE